MSWKCDYFTGMFSNEPHPTDIVAYAEEEAARFHEAGHAVVGYTLGLGCTAVSVSANYTTLDDGRLGVAYSGLALIRRPRRKSLSVQELVKHATLYCAGPAAERRYRHCAGLPQRSLLSSAGDHDGVEAIRMELFARGRNGCAVERLAWHLAQKQILTEPIWNAIEWLAAELAKNFEYPDDDPNPGDVVTSKIRGPWARAIMRRCAASGYGTLNGNRNDPIRFTSGWPTRPESQSG